MSRPGKRAKLEDDLDNLLPHTHGDLNQLNYSAELANIYGSTDVSGNEDTSTSASAVHHSRGPRGTPGASDTVRMVNESIAAQQQAEVAAVAAAYQYPQPIDYTRTNSANSVKIQIPGSGVVPVASGDVSPVAVGSVGTGVSVHSQSPASQVSAKHKLYDLDQLASSTQGSPVSTGLPGIGDPSEYLITPMIEEQEFDNVDVLKEFVKEFGRKNEFGIAIAHSNSKAIYFTCELGGAYREKKSKKAEFDPADKKVGSKKIRCPFAMVANFSKKKDFWTLKITQNKHNHTRLNPLLNFPMLRKRTSQVNATIRDLYSSGDKPSIIHEKLKAIFPGLIIKREDIYNEIRILKKRGLVPSQSQLKARKARNQMSSSASASTQALQAAQASQAYQAQSLDQSHLGTQPLPIPLTASVPQQQHQQHQQQQQSQPLPPWPDYQHLNTDAKKEEAAAAAVAAVEAFNEATGVTGDQQHQQLPQSVPHQHQAFQHYQNAQQAQYQYAYPPGTSANKEEDHFNIDERLLGDN